MSAREGGKAVILIACTALKTVMDLEIMVNISASNLKKKKIFTMQYHRDETH